MRFSPRVGTVTSAVLLVSASLGGQTQQPVDSGATYTTSATAVLVDAVVRDKSGRPVLDLAKSDFEVSEDGVPQDVGSFTLVSKGTGIGIAVRHRTPDAERTAVVQPTGAPVSNDRSSPSVVALVFDALSAESLALSPRPRGVARRSDERFDPALSIRQPARVGFCRLRQRPYPAVR